MKILILSNVRKSTDVVVERLREGHSIVAKEVNATNKELVNIARNELSKGYDVCVMIPSDPVGASILLNKQESINAAVCSFAEDVELGKENGANVFVINPKTEELEEIGDAISELDYNKNFFAAKIGKAIKKISSMKIGKAGQQQQQGAKGQAEEEEESEEEEKELEEEAKKGIIGKIKSALGII